MLVFIIIITKFRFKWYYHNSCRNTLQIYNKMLHSLTGMLVRRNSGRFLSVKWHDITDTRTLLPLMIHVVYTLNGNIQ